LALKSMLIHGGIERAILFGKIRDFAWHDGNQEFFVRSPAGGSSPLRLEFVNSIDDGVQF